MYINITDSEKGNNKASSGALVHYWLRVGIRRGKSKGILPAVR